MNPSKKINTLPTRIYPILCRFNQSPVLEGLRKTVVSSIPVMVVGFFAILFLLFPQGDWTHRLAQSFPSALGLLGVWVPFYFPYIMAKERETDRGNTKKDADSHRRKDKTSLHNKPFFSFMDFRISPGGVVSGIGCFLIFIISLPLDLGDGEDVGDILLMLSHGGVLVSVLISFVYIGVEGMLRGYTVSYLFSPTESNHVILNLIQDLTQYLVPQIPKQVRNDGELNAYTVSAPVKRDSHKSHIIRNWCQDLYNILCRKWRNQFGMRVDMNIYQFFFPVLQGIFPYWVLFALIFILKSMNINIYKISEILLLPLLSLGDTLPVAVVIVFLMCLFWFLGIHGTGVVGGAVFPFYLTLYNQNLSAKAQGLVMPYIVTPPFFIWAMIGGTGATLPLCVYMLFSKSARLRKLAKISILPSLCQINEPLMFGVPLILNPTIAVPFLLVPVILTVINYTAMYFNWVERIFVLVPFVVPQPFYAYFSNMDIKSVFLMLLDMLIAFMIWHPFFKTLEETEIKNEKME